MHRNLSESFEAQTEIESLHQATLIDRNAVNRLPKGPPTTKRISRKRTVLVSLGGGIAIAAVVYLVLPQIHDCKATVRLIGNSDATWLDVVHKRLGQTCSVVMSAPNTSLASLVGWRTAVTEPDRLHLIVSTSDQKAGTELVQKISKQFIDEQDVVRAKSQSTPTESEQVLFSWASILRRRMEDANGQVEKAKSQLPDRDPEKSQSELQNQWSELLAEFEGQRANLLNQIKHLEQLREQPDPSHAVVDPSDRKSALQADPALQQDFQELSVRLSETKQHLLTAWQKSAEPLGSLHRASKELATLIQDCVNPNATKEERVILQSIKDLGGQHADKLAAFSSAWGREFNDLRQAEVQPQSDDILAAFSRLRNLLADFVFQGGELTAHMRDRVNELASASSDPARGAVLQSRLAGSFQAVQSAQHNFEFSAGILDPKANFKLDAALRASRALWKRSHQQVLDIESRLQQEATKAAKSNRQDDIASAVVAVEQSRASLDETVARLVAIQSELNQNTGMLENYFRDSLRVEVTTSHINDVSEDLNLAEKQIRRLEAARQAEALRPVLQFESCESEISKPRLIERLRIAGLAGLASCVVLPLVMRRLY